MVSVGRGAVVGGGSVVLPQVVIGDNAVIGAGCVVQENVPSCALVVGNPGRVMRIGVSGYKDMSI
jgi:maltose O-acetyltransferase